MHQEAFTHLNDKAQPSMVNVIAKAPTRRRAHARAIVQLPAETARKLAETRGESSKGPVFQTAIIAGISAAKRTSELIPLCHPIGLDHCDVDVQMNASNQVVIEARCEVDHKTGVEMEALAAAAVAALTVYDMCKGLSHEIVIKDIQLIEKTGGKQDYRAE